MSATNTSTSSASTTSPTKSASPASPSTTAPITPAASSTGPAFDLKGTIASAKRSFDQTAQATNESTLQAKIFWNEKIAKPANQGIKAANVEFQKVRQEYPGIVVGGVTASVFLLSAASGRGGFRTIRNTSFAAILSGLAMAPAATIGTLALLRDRIATAAGYNRPTTVVVQQPIIIPVPAPSSATPSPTAAQTKK